MPPLLEVRDLRTEFRTGAGVVPAVDGISYTVERGETVAIVGESGSGKTAGALSILRLIPDPPGRITGGQILFDGALGWSIAHRAQPRFLAAPRLGFVRPRRSWYLGRREGRPPPGNPAFNQVALAK